jgi:hypothetical protein
VITEKSNILIIGLKKKSLDCVSVRASKEATIKKCKDKKLRFFFIEDTVMRDNIWKEVCENNLRKENGFYRRRTYTNGLDSCLSIELKYS